MYLNTLGVAYYRACRFALAIKRLKESLAANRGEFDAFDLFFLAMARHRLGDRKQARADFNRGIVVEESTRVVRAICPRACRISLRGRTRAAYSSRRDARERFRTNSLSEKGTRIFVSPCFV